MPNNGASGSIGRGSAWIASSAGGGITMRLVLPFFGKGSSSSAASRGVYGVRCRRMSTSAAAMSRSPRTSPYASAGRVPTNACQRTSARQTCPYPSLPQVAAAASASSNTWPSVRTSMFFLPGPRREPEPEERVALDQTGTARVAEHRAETSDRPAHLADLKPFERQLDVDVAQDHVAVLGRRTA